MTRIADAVQTAGAPITINNPNLPTTFPGAVLALSALGNPRPVPSIPASGLGPKDQPVIVIPFKIRMVGIINLPPQTQKYSPTLQMFFNTNGAAVEILNYANASFPGVTEPVPLCFWIEMFFLWDNQSNTIQGSLAPPTSSLVSTNNANNGTSSISVLTSPSLFYYSTTSLSGITVTLSGGYYSTATPGNIMLTEFSLLTVD